MHRQGVTRGSVREGAQRLTRSRAPLTLRWPQLQSRRWTANEGDGDEGSTGTTTSQNAPRGERAIRAARRQERREAGGMARAGASPRDAAQPQERKCLVSGPPRARLACRPVVPAGAQGAAARLASGPRSTVSAASVGPRLLPFPRPTRIRPIRMGRASRSPNDSYALCSVRSRFCTCFVIARRALTNVLRRSRSKPPSFRMICVWTVSTPRSIETWMKCPL